METTISIFCIFIRVYHVTYVKIQFNHSKLCKFISSWKMGQHLGQYFFLHKTSENQWWNVLYISRYDVTYAEFKTLLLYNLLKSDQNTAKLCKGSFSIKLTKYATEAGVTFWLQVPFKMVVSTLLNICFEELIVTYYEHQLRSKSVINSDQSHKLRFWGAYFNPTWYFKFVLSVLREVLH